MQGLPLVTVFTLIYNTNPRFIIDAIKSIRDNGYGNIQHIIIDDCSTNVKSKHDVVEWIKKNNYPCEYYEHHENFGVCKTLNEVLSLAKGKYIFGCSDDLIMPLKIATEVQLLEQLPDEYAAVYSNAYLIDDNDNSIDGMFIEKYRSFERYPNGDIFSVLIEQNFLPCMAMIWKTELLRKEGGYDEELGYEDFDMNLRLARKYKIYYSEYVSAKYRIHANSLMFTKKDWKLDYFKICRKHADVSTVREKIFYTIYGAYKDGEVYAKNMADWFNSYYGKTLLTTCILRSIPFSLYYIIDRIVSLVRRYRFRNPVTNRL